MLSCTNIQLILTYKNKFLFVIFFNSFFPFSVYKSVRLFLASGVINDIGHWSVDYTDQEDPLGIIGINFLECYRNQIVGYDAAVDVKLAINNNLFQLISEIEKDGYIISRPSVGFSFDLSLQCVENIFDFWCETYKNKLLWDKYIKLVKFRQNSGNFSMFLNNAFRGETSEYLSVIEELYSFRPNSTSKIQKNKFDMW